MNHTRAYLAGFGTGGALVACAALVFVVASALVAFNGMPGDRQALAPLSVTMPASQAGSGAVAATRLAAFAAATATAPGGHVPTRPAGPGRGGAAGARGARRVSLGDPASVVRRGPGVAGGGPAAGGGGSPVPSPGTVLSRVTGTTGPVLSPVTGTTRKVLQTVLGGTGSTVSRVGQSLGLGTPGPAPGAVVGVVTHTAAGSVLGG